MKLFINSHGRIVESYLLQDGSVLQRICLGQDKVNSCVTNFLNLHNDKKVSLSEFLQLAKKAV